MLENCTLEAFRKLVGHRFVLPEVPAPAALELAEANPLGGEGADGGRRPFSLIFVGPLQPVLPQQIHRLSEPSLGVVDIFLVPVGPCERGMQYEAVFT